MWDHIAEFLTRFKSIESLGAYLFDKAGFTKVKGDSLLFAYNQIKDELEDGTTFEDFIERLN